MTESLLENELALYKWQKKDDFVQRKIRFSYVLNCDDLPNGLIHFPKPITENIPENQKSYIFSIL